ncbi:MAG: PAS domain S-box protein [Haloquadratum sp.]
MSTGSTGDDPGDEWALPPAELRAVFDAVEDAIIVHAPDGSIVDANRAATEMYGYARDELRGESIGAISSGPESPARERAVERIQRAVAGDSQRFEWRSEDREGNTFWTEASLSRTELRERPHVVAVVRDIDDRKELERRFQTLIDNLPGIVYRCRNETGWPMEFVGGQSQTLTGYAAETIESGEVSWGEDVIHPDDAASVRREVETALDADEPFEVTYRIRTAGGDERWVWERGRRVDVAASDAELLEGLITDITPRKRYEERLEAQRDDLELLNEVLRHDVRNDLQLVTAYADILAEECDDEEVHSQIRTIRENADHAVELTTTARDMAEVMLSPTERSEQDLEPVLEAELTEVRSTYSGAVVVADAVPDVSVHADELLGSVFRNLLKNAVQHNDKPVPKVRVSAADRGDSVRVRVADNGPGIPDARKEDIFGKGDADFGSAESGIGLYLVRTLVESYGGDVWVEDGDERSPPAEVDGEPLTGAVFVVELPTADR